MTRVHHGKVSWNLQILGKQYVAFRATPKQIAHTESIRKVNATYVSKAIPDQHSMHQYELPFASIFRRRLIFAVFGRRLISPYIVL